MTATVVAELYGEPTTPYAKLQSSAVSLADRLARVPLVADVDTSNKPPERFALKMKR